MRCAACDGMGLEADAAGEPRVCRRCAGEGEVLPYGCSCGRLGGGCTCGRSLVERLLEASKEAEEDGEPGRAALFHEAARALERQDPEVPW